MARTFMGCVISRLLFIWMIILPAISATALTPPLSQVEFERVIKIKLAADTGLKARREWRMSVRALVTQCSHVFHNRFGLQFKIEETEYWTLKSSPDSMGDVMNDLMAKVRPGGHDIVLGVVPPEKIRAIPQGLSSYVRGYVLLGYRDSKEAMKSILLHELCHIFGAVDLCEPGSIMNIENPGSRIDDFTSSFILLNRDRSFGAASWPLPSRHLDDAILLFRKRAALDLGEAEVHWILSLLYFQKREYAKALEQCKKVQELNPRRKEIHNILGNIYLQQGETDKAIEEYQEARGYFPHSADLHFNLGLTYSRKGLLDRAVSEYQEAIELDPLYKRAYTGLGGLYLKMGAIDRALEQCQAALGLFPEDVKILSLLAAALIIKNDGLRSDTFSSPTKRPGGDKQTPEFSTAGEFLERAEECCLKALEINPGLPEVHNSLGVAYSYLGKTKEAEVEFSQALELKPDYVHAHYNLGLLYFHLELWGKSAYHVQKFIEIYVSKGLGPEILSRFFGEETRYFISTANFQ
jgi:tetratricopeptide (TPR) repeat protein